MEHVVHCIPYQSTESTMLAHFSFTSMHSFRREQDRTNKERRGKNVALLIRPCHPLHISCATTSPAATEDALGVLATE
jgi:hypothetical protein